MTEVKTEDGSVMETNLPAEKVADLQVKPETEPAKPDAPQASQTIDEQKTAEQGKADNSQKPADQQKQDGQQKREKPKPIATLLQKKHDAEERARIAEEKLEALSKRPDNAATSDDVKALAEELGADPSVLQKIVDFARKGMNPQLPKEVQDLIAQNKAQAETAAEEQAFKTDLGRLEGTLKDEQLKDPKVREKLQALAYSEELAPDGEPYFKKPLYELYMNYVKPEIEPGKASAEPSRGGSKAGGKVVDFAEIAADEIKLSDFVRTSTKEQFAKFHAWQLAHQKEPLRKPGF